MKSTTPQQATWKTSDGSQWWLRSTRYNEPNGDYTANCFLDLWRSPFASENNIQFNDGRCNYRSRSYYCQPKRQSKLYGGHHRRRRAQIVKKPVKKIVKKQACPPSYPYLARGKIAGLKICYNQQSYASRGGPCSSWCSLDGKAGSGCGDNAKKLCKAKLSGIKPPVGIVQNYDQGRLFRAGWKVWSDVPYRHHTTKRDIQPTKGACVLWGSKTSAGSTRLKLAAFGRRNAIKNKNRVWENGVYWYTWTNGRGSGSCGFSPNQSLSLNSADTNNSQRNLRLSWHLHTNMKVGGYRSGSTTGLNGNRYWRKIVMYGPCKGVKAGKR